MSDSDKPTLRGIWADVEITDDDILDARLMFFSEAKARLAPEMDALRRRIEELEAENEGLRLQLKKQEEK